MRSRCGLVIPFQIYDDSWFQKRFSCLVIIHYLTFLMGKNALSVQSKNLKCNCKRNGIYENHIAYSRLSWLLDCLALACNLYRVSCVDFLCLSKCISVCLFAVCCWISTCYSDFYMVYIAKWDIHPIKITSVTSLCLQFSSNDST